MRFRIALLAAGLGAAALMAGCDPQSTAAPAASPAPFSPVKSVTSAGSPTDPAGVSVPPSGAPSASTAAKRAAAPAGGCPVTADTLLSALRSDTSDMYQRAGSPAALVEATCYEGYAVARTASDGRHDRVSVVFRYDAAATVWHPLNLGSADFCADVPAAVRPHLPGCE